MVNWEDERCRGGSGLSEVGEAGRCQRNALIGQKYCASHLSGEVRAREAGGMSVRATYREVAGQMAALMAEHYEEQESPAVGLLSAVRLAGALMRSFGEMVGGLNLKMTWEPIELPGGESVPYPSSVQTMDRYGEAQVHVLVREYRLSIETYARACKIAMDAGIAAAQVRIEAYKAQKLADAVTGIFKELDLTPEQRSLAPSLVRKHLLALDGGELPDLEAQAVSNGLRGET